MINLRESHNQYQKLSLLFVTLLGIVMTFISVPASGYSEAWGGCLIPVGTETATSGWNHHRKYYPDSCQRKNTDRIFNVYLATISGRDRSYICHTIFGFVSIISLFTLRFWCAFGSGLGRKIIDLSIFSFATCAGSTVLGIGALVSERPQKVTSRRTFSFP